MRNIQKPIDQLASIATKSISGCLSVSAYCWMLLMNKHVYSAGNYLQRPRTGILEHAWLHGKMALLR
jgi:hypothetical protein